ncbi:pentachlorophenol monooxygenase [Xylariales sp. AK1849]|nr:pentachlorophenol monooxygenase [Xylariales sp. AK1849]
MRIPTSADVIVGGAGPTGLVTACMLLKLGISVVVVDAAPAPATTSRASTIHLRTLEILEKLDVTDKILKLGLPIRTMTLYDRDALLSTLGFAGLHDRYDHAVALPQTETEGLLTQTLLELGGVIYRDWSLTGLIRNDKTGVEVAVENNTTKEVANIKAKYAVAADGLQSTLRHAVHVDFTGSAYPLDFVTADVRMDPQIWPHQGDRDQVRLYVKPEGFLLVVPFPSPENDLWRVIGTVESAPKNPNREYLERLILSRGPTIPLKNEALVTEVVWGSRFRIHHRLAMRYRINRVFLAGDAAHVHSPAGGQGMNTGIQDAETVASIIADALVGGRDKDVDLDRYEKERRPVAQRVVSLTHRLTVVMTISSPILCWARNWFIWTAAKFVPGSHRRMAWQLSELEH